MVTVGSRRVAASSWTHWGLRQYVNQGSFQDVVAKMFWVSLVEVSNFNCFLLCWAILILSSTHEHFRLAEGISKDMANIVFNKAARKVIKDAVKHARLVSIFVFYM
jgi:hypothetical protein